MSRENLDRVRTVYDAAARGDIDAAFELYAPDIEWDVTPSASAQVGLDPVYRGHEGVRRYWRDYLSAFERLDFELEELVDASGRILAVVRERAVGRASGIAFEARIFAVWTLRDGKITRMQGFRDREEASKPPGCGSRRCRRKAQRDARSVSARGCGGPGMLPRTTQSVLRLPPGTSRRDPGRRSASTPSTTESDAPAGGEGRLRGVDARRF